jgi:hypothetical protein
MRGIASLLCELAQQSRPRTSKWVQQLEKRTAPRSVELDKPNSTVVHLQGEVPVMTVGRHAVSMAGSVVSFAHLLLEVLALQVNNVRLVEFICECCANCQHEHDGRSSKDTLKHFDRSWSVSQPDNCSSAMAVRDLAQVESMSCVCDRVWGFVNAVVPSAAELREHARVRGDRTHRGQEHSFFKHSSTPGHFLYRYASSRHHPARSCSQAWQDRLAWHRNRRLH